LKNAPQVASKQNKCEDCRADQRVRDDFTQNVSGKNAHLRVSSNRVEHAVSARFHETMHFVSRWNARFDWRKNVRASRAVVDVLFDIGDGLRPIARRHEARGRSPGSLDLYQPCHASTARTHGYI